MSSGGCVRNAFTSCDRTRPHASSSATRSSSSAVAPSSTAFSASATGISAMALLRNLEVSGLAALLFDQADALDADAAIDRLHHVVDRQAADRDRGQRFHLDAGATGDLDGRAHAAAGKLAVGFTVALDLRQEQR